MKKLFISLALSAVACKKVDSHKCYDCVTTTTDSDFSTHQITKHFKYDTLCNFSDNEVDSIKNVAYDSGTQHVYAEMEITKMTCK